MNAEALFSLAFLFLLSSTVAPLSPDPDHVKILSAERRIDLTSSIVRVYLSLKVENSGPSLVSKVLLAFPPKEAEHLAILKASLAEGKRKKKTYLPLTVEPANIDGAPNGARLFYVHLNAPLKAGQATDIEALYVLTHHLEPFPAEISQSDSQLVYYQDSAVLLSPYHVVEQTTFVKVPSNRVESFTKVEPSSRTGVELKYGPYVDRSLYSYSPVLIHFENNNPFAVIEELVREVEISHWGNIQITEHYKLKHAGARHKGVFSRLEYQSRPAFSGASSFKHFIVKLPPRVHSVYYRDDIGNISSSHLRVDSVKSELEIEPRYPLFGGWRATFVIGYGLPLEDFLFESLDGQRFLNFSFGCPISDTVVDELTIKVVLPEGSKSPHAAVPFSVEQHLETSYSYLDVWGRTTLVLKKKNVVADHNVPFQVYYEFNPIYMLVEPFILVSAVSLLFVACMSYMHIDLSIRKSS